ncbi:response regulator transcription factor [Xiamenia xianingshaonis]|uniref:response regulator transcription factor n=1 Tax=Xiamenia xianingshaonis TaxID=2682776 RepID=UPI0028F6C98F|nr:helix-turn-helix transcriptional regulator [Xiamenia xianingshaonis]
MGITADNNAAAFPTGSVGPGGRAKNAADPASAPFSPAIFRPVPDDAAAPGTARLGLHSLDAYGCLWPCVLGLAFSRIGVLTGAYGSYAASDEGIFTDGSMLVALTVFGILLAWIALRKKTLAKAATNRLMRACVFVEFLTLAGLAALELTDAPLSTWRFVLCVTCTLTASGAMFYWLRRMRGCASATAAVFVFSALIVSEVVVYACALLPPIVEHGFAAALVLLQYPCTLWARSREKAHAIDALTPESDYFSVSGDVLANKKFLSATAIGIACMGAVTGLLRGYPDGLPIPFSPVTRVAYGLLVIVVSAVVIALVLKRFESVMTVGFFILLEAVACLALILFSAFPHSLDIGAVLATTLNALMVGFVWYITIAFMSAGWRDPYYYAMSGWIVWLGSRAVARVALLEIYPLHADTLVLCAVMGSLIVLSTQVVFVQFLGISQVVAHNRAQTIREQAAAAAERRAADAASGTASADSSATKAGEGGTTPQGTLAQGAAKESILTRIMGLDQQESLTDMRQATLEHNAQEIGSQFMLSEREIEVLALYARGLTQKRVAEELYISPGTAHAHIKRIYAKTGLHSRQEIIDYMEKYAS